MRNLEGGNGEMVNAGRNENVSRIVQPQLHFVYKKPIAQQSMTRGIFFQSLDFPSISKHHHYDYTHYLMQHACFRGQPVVSISQPKIDPSSCSIGSR